MTVEPGVASGFTRGEGSVMTRVLPFMPPRQRGGAGGAIKRGAPPPQAAVSRVPPPVTVTVVMPPDVTVEAGGKLPRRRELATARRPKDGVASTG